MALPPDVELIETLGEGSFGTVYVARLEDGAIRRTVVLKVLKAAWLSNEDILHRARDEAALLSRLNHDNIIKVEQLSTLHGRPAVVMEFVRGLTLDQIVNRTGPLPVGVALQVVGRVAGALDAAFNKIPPGMDAPLRVIHRDVKPSNIILSVTGAVKVLDFGTARGEFGAREAETVNVTLGSPRYMAPERFDGVDSGPSVDIYALGVTFYELLSGRPMGRLSINPDRHARQIEERISAIRDAQQGGSPHLEALLKLQSTALAYQPEDRPSAADFRSDCLDLLSELPGVSVTLDRFCESVVEPLYEKRKRLPPVPLEGTLATGASDSLSNSVSSARLKAGTSSGVRTATSSLLLAAGGGTRVMLLAVAGVITAVGGMLILRSNLDKPDVPPPILEERIDPGSVFGGPDGREDLEAEIARALATDNRVTPTEEAPAPEVELSEEALPEETDEQTGELPEIETAEIVVEEAVPEEVEVEEVEVEEVEVEEVEVEEEVVVETVTPSVVSVTVKTLPAGVSVQLAGVRIPRTPATIELAPGEDYRAVVSWATGVTLRCQGITIREDTVLTFYDRERPGKPKCPGG